MKETRWAPRQGDKKRVVVVGAGIAGMTAAHELVERGYEVEVIEMAGDPYAPRSPRVGGMARTSWASAPPPFDQVPQRPAAPSRGSTASMQQLELDRSPLPITVPLQELLTIFPGSAADNFVKSLRPEDTLSVIVSRDLSPGEDLALKEFFEPLRGRWNLSILLGEAPKDRAWLSVEAARVPGEHGFRFFPSFYRHMFDTMKRVPIAEAAIGSNDIDGAVLTSDSSRSVFDALLSAEVIQIGLEAEERRTRSFEIERRPIRSLQRIRQFFTDLLERAGYRGQDLYHLVTRYIEYLVSASERRTKEYENISWSRFLGLGGGGFSDYFARHVNSGAQALVAMSSTTNDARTIGSIAMQLTLDQIRTDPSGYTDATLRGPTSIELFEPWQAYLKSQNVQFTCAQLIGFYGHGMVVRPAFGLRASDAKMEFRYVEITPADYYVITIPVDAFQALFDKNDPEGRSVVSWSRNSLSPHLFSRDELLAANTLCLELDRCEARLKNSLAHENSDDVRKYFEFEIGDFAGHPDQGPLRYMCGIQFYFEADIRVLVGHTICLDSLWGVSYLSQIQYWQDAPRGQSGVRGVISAIFTLFEVPAPDRAGQNLKTAQECSASEVAERVWKQIMDSWDAQRQGPLPEPVYFSLDESLRREHDRWTNLTPYLVNRVGDWGKRGGVRISDDDYAYQIQLGHTVFAGAFMRTQTRLNTMEASNESGRRAVNAILDYDTLPCQRCRLWNIEDHEIPELLPLRDLDRRIFRRGGRHPLRNGGVEAMLRIMPWDLVRLGLPSRGEG